MSIIRRQRNGISSVDALQTLVSFSTDPHAPPCTMKPRVSGVSLDDLRDERLEQTRQLLAQHGCVLLRSFQVEGAAMFSSFIKRLAKTSAHYREPATPRTHVHGDVFTSTEYPSDQSIPLHNENSHCVAWPMTIAFFCETPASTRGGTPIADCRGVLKRLSEPLLSEFERRKIRYIRRFGDGLGFSWQKVFGVDTRQALEAYCADSAMTPYWTENGLYVTYERDAIHRHPLTGERLWFNHGLFFNPASMPDQMRNELFEQVGAQALPYDTCYGDGQPFERETLEAIRAAYEAETRVFEWQTGDVLVLDNMRFAHGREPYTGPRRILVGMSDDISTLAGS
ncbi:TauD/TfdA family dioxygenase [Pseudomonas palleroniana]|uniref:TauD/TfdA family dioxygenase n=1 Tax=Pseudomonas palleroniana TaxID=191390 RepID=UPI001FD2ED2A|nr:TauD/TfdA family dioxygenase [Pseudomonas palleroniana]UOP09616.1 TauD/TfdA family dioxygenase [Pseudomonas palleroniana]